MAIERYEVETKTLWLDILPTELRTRIAKYATQGTRNGLQLAESSPAQAKAVAASHDNTLQLPRVDQHRWTIALASQVVGLSLFPFDDPSTGASAFIDVLRAPVLSQLRNVRVPAVASVLRLLQVHPYLLEITLYLCDRTPFHDVTKALSLQKNLKCLVLYCTAAWTQAFVFHTSSVHDIGFNASYCVFNKLIYHNDNIRDLMRSSIGIESFSLRCTNCAKKLDAQNMRKDPTWYILAAFPKLKEVSIMPHSSKAVHGQTFRGFENPLNVPDPGWEKMRKIERVHVRGARDLLVPCLVGDALRTLETCAIALSRDEILKLKGCRKVVELRLGLEKDAERALLEIIQNFGKLEKVELEWEQIVGNGGQTGYCEAGQGVLLDIVKAGPKVTEFEMYSVKTNFGEILSIVQEMKTRLVKLGVCISGQDDGVFERLSNVVWDCLRSGVRLTEFCVSNEDWEALATEWKGAARELRVEQKDTLVRAFERMGRMEPRFDFEGMIEKVEAVLEDAE